jgi:hypothetical protein
MFIHRVDAKVPAVSGKLGQSEWFLSCAFSVELPMHAKKGMIYDKLRPKHWPCVVA